MQINEIKSNIYNIYNFTKKLSEKEILNTQSDLIYKYFYELDDLAALTIKDSDVEVLLNDEEFQAAIKEISRFRAYFNIRLELERADKIIQSNSPWQVIRDFKFYNNYIKLANMEFTGAELKQEQSILFLGSGPLPLSLIIMCNSFNLKGIGVEQNSEYVRISKAVINKLKIESKIEIIKGNHFSLPIGNPSLIMIAAAAIPKEKIFSHLKTNIPPGTKVSYRVYEYGLRKILDVDNRLLLADKKTLFSFLREYKEIKPDPPVNNTCVFGRI